MLPDIDVQAPLKRKRGAGMRRCRILGARNPAMAHEAPQAEPPIGTMLPRNVVMRERAEDGAVEAAAADPAAPMQATAHPRLAEIAGQIRTMLREAVEDVTG